MFTKNSVSKSMISAVESVLAEDKKLLLEPDAEKKGRKKKDGVNEMDKSQTPPGRDGGHRPGPDQYVKPITKEKMVKHALDILSKSNAKKDDKKDVKEELKGDQHKLDKNHNGKLDSHDFKLLRMKKEGILDSMKSGAKKVVKKVVDTVGHKDDDDLLKDLEKETGGKRPNMYNKPKNEEVESVEERTLTPDETSEKERIVKGMKKGLTGFKARYGDRAKSVMYATATKQAKNEEVETVEEDIGAMQSVVGENKGKKAIRVDTLQGVTTSTDPEVKNANAHFSGKKATLKAEGKSTDTAVPFVTDSVSPTQREINKAVKPTFKKIKEMLGKTGTGESELPANAQIPG